MDYEDALRESASTATTARPLGEPVASGSRLLRSDVPVRKQGTILIELSCDIQLVIDGLKLGREPLWARGPHYYVAREASAGTCGVEQVSNWLGCVLRACDRRHSIEEIVNRLATDIPEVDASLRDYVYRRLLRERRLKDSSRFIACLPAQPPIQLPTYPQDVPTPMFPACTKPKPNTRSCSSRPSI